MLQFFNLFEKVASNYRNFDKNIYDLDLSKIHSIEFLRRDIIEKKIL